MLCCITFSNIEEVLKKISRESVSSWTAHARNKWLYTCLRLCISILLLWPHNILNKTEHILYTTYSSMWHNWTSCRSYLEPRRSQIPINLGRHGSTVWIMLDDSDWEIQFSVFWFSEKWLWTGTVVLDLQFPSGCVKFLFQLIPSSSRLNCAVQWTVKWT